MTSIFNHVLGPIMRGPSSSHTAAAFHIGRMARSLFGGTPAEAAFALDADGSYAKTYREQGADLAFATGLLGWELTDERFESALAQAEPAGVRVSFAVGRLPDADHPNTVEIRLAAPDGRRLEARANSIGGGAVEFTRLDGWPVRLVGDAYEVAVEAQPAAVAQVVGRLAHLGPQGRPEVQTRGDLALATARLQDVPPAEAWRELASLPGVRTARLCEPVYFVHRGAPLFASAAEILAWVREQDTSLGEAAIAYEAALLGLRERQVLDEMERRLAIMEAAARQGIEGRLQPMQLLRPSAGEVFAAEAGKRVAVGGLHTRAAARALAVMHVNSSRGVVCAAPTGGSAGVLPGVVVTLLEEGIFSRAAACRALLAAGLVGVVVANRATFAAEVAGCQVEIGAAGAMAAAAVVDAAGGSPAQALNAAAIAFQNTMGSVCDLVQGIVEIPCHTRNAAAAANAFLCADLAMGGYANPIGLDETIDAVYAVGKMLPPELRCTALGGLAATPTALAMERVA